MKSSDNLSENRIWILYTLVVLGIFVSFAILTTFSFHTINKMAQDDVNDVAMSSIEADAEIISNKLDEGRRKLEVVSRLTEYILQKDTSLFGVESLFVSETKRYRDEKELVFSCIYGLVNGRFITGNPWTPDFSYDPEKRPWYKSALRAMNYDVQLTPFISYHDQSRSVAMSKVLSDKKSVIALNMSIEGARGSYRDRWKKDRRWMLLNTNGEILDHHDESMIGENLFSNKYWGSDLEELARKSLRISKEKVRMVQYGDNHVAYVASIQNQWVLVKFFDGSDIASALQWNTTRNIMIAVFLFLGITLFVLYVFLQYRKLVRKNRIRTFIREKMDHDLHATINGILGMNAVVVKSVHDENTRIFSEGVQSALQNFDYLVRDNQDVFAQDGAIKSESREFSLFEVLAQCYTMVVPRARMKNLKVIFDCDPDIPSSLWGNASHLRQIINNLLSDSFKRTESGSIVLSVSGDMEPRSSLSIEDHCLLKFTIRDTGKGVNMKHDARIEEWINASAELCLAKLMLDSCGCELVVKSRYGEGTTFMFSLRQLVLNNAPMGDFESRYNSNISSNSKSLDTLFAPAARILVVDDVELNLKVVCGLLKESKVQIDTAVNGTQCLEMVSSKHYDLIFLDYSLPEMNGVEVFERMKKISTTLNQSTPVIMVTAETVELKDSILKTGLTDYMVKPYFEKDLLRMLAWYLPKELVLTQEDLIEFTQKSIRAAKPIVVKKEPVDEQIEFHSVLTPEEKLKVFSGVLDIQKGLDYFSRDVRCYFEVLQEFSREDKRYGIDKTYQMKDWNNYLILLHSVSGVANAIGAILLAEKALTVEKACREYKFDSMEELHKSFMMTYVETMDAIGKGVLDYEN